MPQADVLVFKPTDCMTRLVQARPATVICLGVFPRISCYCCSPKEANPHLLLLHEGWEILDRVEDDDDALFALSRCKLWLSSLLVDSRFMCFRSVGKETEQLVCLRWQWTSRREPPSWCLFGIDWPSRRLGGQICLGMCLVRS